MRASIGVPQFFNEASYAVWSTFASSFRCARLVALCKPLVSRITPPHVHAKVREVFPINNPDRVNIHQIEENAHLLDKLEGLGLVSPYRPVIGVLPQADSAINFCNERF